MAAVASAVCIAQAAVLVTGSPPVHPMTMNAVGMGTGAALLLAGSMVAREPHVLPQQMATWAAVGYLVVVGSVMVFVLYLVALRFWAASRAAYGFVLIPFVTVLLSAWLDDEPLGIGVLLGGLLVLSGVYVGVLRPTGPASSPDGSHLDADIRSSPHSSGAGLVTQLFTRQQRIVHGVLACAVLAAQVGWAVQPVRSCQAEWRLVE